MERALALFGLTLVFLGAGSFDMLYGYGWLRALCTAVVLAGGCLTAFAVWRADGNGSKPLLRRWLLIGSLTALVPCLTGFLGEPWPAFIGICWFLLAIPTFIAALFFLAAAGLTRMRVRRS